DGRWFGNDPTLVAEVSGFRAAALIPKIEAAIDVYESLCGRYRVWPGPNSNTFVASIVRATPVFGIDLPPTALGKDFRPRPYAGVTASRTGVELSLWGIAALKIGWVEGLELSLLGLVVGVDIRRPGLKLPGLGRVGPGIRSNVAGARELKQLTVSRSAIP